MSNLVNLPDWAHTSSHTLPTNLETALREIAGSPDLSSTDIQTTKDAPGLKAVSLLALANGRTIKVISTNVHHSYTVHEINRIDDFDGVAEAIRKQILFTNFNKLGVRIDIDPLEAYAFARRSGLAFLCNSLVDQLHNCTPQTTSNEIAEIGTELTAALTKLSALTPNSDGTQADRSAEIAAFVEKLQAPALDQRITALITTLDLFGNPGNPTPIKDPNAAYNAVFELVAITNTFDSTIALPLARQVDIAEALVRFEGTFTTNNPDIRTTQFVIGQATNLIFKLNQSLRKDDQPQRELVNRYNAAMHAHHANLTRSLTL